MANIAVPKYLKDIETKVHKKLKILGKLTSDIFETQQLHYDSVLEIYQEAFQNLIDNTRTCSKILNDIKNAYEQAIQIRDERISQFITQDKIFGISAKKKQRDDKMNSLIQEIEELKKHNSKLSLEISKLKKDMGKLKDESFSEYLCVMRERDARYTLYFENVALHMKLRELDGSSQPDHQPHGDPTVLRIALDRCREQLSKTQTELKKMTDEYADTVPRREFDTLEARHSDVTKALQATQNELRTLQDSFNKALATKKSIDEELFETKERCRELERAGTPRPHWELCADFISGGRDRWCQLASGLSSRETLLVLLKELGPAAQSDHLEYFDGLGTSGSVPPYLRWSGRVRNLRLSRRELCVLVEDIWRGREAHLHLSMHDYLATYFEERYQQGSMRAEWAYNLCAAAEQMQDEPAVRVLCAALHQGGGGGAAPQQGSADGAALHQGAAGGAALHYGAAGGAAPPERAYWALREQWRALRDRLTHLAADHHMVTLEELQRACKATFPLKNELEIRSLTEVARKQLKMRTTTQHFSLDKLFQESEEGFLRVELARELYRQRGAAAQVYLRELLAELGGRRARDRLVTVDALKRAIAIVDPAIDHIRMEQMVRCALGGGGGAPLHAVAARLAAADLERVGPRGRASRRHLYN